MKIHETNGFVWILAAGIKDRAVWSLLKVEARLHLLLCYAPFNVNMGFYAFVLLH